MQTFIIVTLMTLSLASASPLDLGRGGVYNSPAAQEYWNRRFGSGFFSNLASIQRGIDARASRNKANLEANVPEAAIGKKHALKKYDQFIRNTSCFCTMCDFHMKTFFVISKMAKNQFLH